MVLVQQQTFPRLFLSALVGTLSLMGFASTDTLFYALVQRNEWSLLSNVLLALFATLAFWETVAVDLLHCTHCMVEKFREGIWGSMAVTLVGYSFIMAKRDSSGVMTVFFLLFGMFCAAIAALDARVEYRRRKYPCSSASSPRSTLPS